MFGPLCLLPSIPKNLLCAERGTLHDDVAKDIEVDEDEKDDDGNVVLLDDEKAYANAADQYYEDGYVYNPATL